jgi:thermitase
MAKRPPSRSPRFESLSFQVEFKKGVKPATVARAALRSAFPKRAWTITPLNEKGGEFEARPKGPRARMSTGEAWQAAYRLREDPRVGYAEPMFELANDEQFPTPPPAVRGARALAVSDEDPGTEGNFEWSLDSLRVPDAWTQFGTAVPGAGVVVGHPDTGYTEHPEILSARLRAADGHDFEDDDDDAKDPLAGGFLRNPGHGTGTSSVIFSSRGLQTGSTGPAFVSGTAPGASLIPIRTTKSVVLWSMSHLTKAVRYAVDNGAHVISISLGGPVPSIALHNAVRDAEASGVIVLCAAGNEVGFVVFPAAFDEVIAVAASRIDDTPWPRSCRGPAVDITAPGSSVWRARTERQQGTQVFSVERGSGTSFAVAATAGIATLWLSFHGRSALIARYGIGRIAAVFKQLLQDHCRTVSGWDTANFGPGIANADALLSATLPANARARGMRGLQRRAVSTDRAPLELLVHYLAPAPRSGVVRAVAELLKVDEAHLPEALDDVGAELAMAVATDAALRQRLREAARASRRRRARAAARGVGGRVAIKSVSPRLRRYLAA